MPVEDVCATIVCTGECGRELRATRENFYYNPRSSSNLRTRCIRCHNEDVKQRQKSPERLAYARQWRQENPESVRWSKLKYRYGVTKEDYDRMLTEQGGGCAICGSADSKNPKLSHLYVDHCHATGKVRGLLCYHCNTLIGNADDSPAKLRTAANYVERHNARQ